MSYTYERLNKGVYGPKMKAFQITSDALRFPPHDRHVGTQAVTADGLGAELLYHWLHSLEQAA